MVADVLGLDVILKKILCPKESKELCHDRYGNNNNINKIVMIDYIL